MILRTSSRALPPWLLALSLLPVPLSGHAEDLQLTAGLKMWATSWTTWGLAETQYNGADFQTVSPLNSDTAPSFIPQLSARYGPWLVSTSYMTSTHFNLTSAQPAGPLRSLGESRREVDANVGYYFVPGLAVTLGYKQLDQSVGGTLNWSGPVVGLTGTLPVGSYGLAAYGTFGYGVLRLTTPQSLADAFGHTGFNANYMLAELGLAYSFYGHYTVTVGYRSQTVRTTGYSLATVSLINGTAAQPYASTELKDITQGPAVGIFASF